MSGHSDLDNHANQMNPNNDAYWESRGEDERPDDWIERSVQDDVNQSQTVHNPAKSNSLSNISWFKEATAVASLNQGVCMNEESKNESNTIPYSGRIIGAVVEALDITDEALTDKLRNAITLGKM